MNFFLLKICSQWETENNYGVEHFFQLLKLPYLNVITRTGGTRYVKSFEAVVLEMQRSLFTRVEAGRGKNL